MRPIYFPGKMALTCRGRFTNPLTPQDGLMFDKTHLMPAEFEFVVLSDTHYMRDAADRPLEFESRRKQTARAEVALQYVAALCPDFVIHLGDLVQEYPGTPDFEPAMDEARAQIERCGLKPFWVAGNHDVGDKFDRTMPTHPASRASLAFFHDRLGPSWYGFDHGGCHFIILNSQILNAELPENAAQWAWLESDLLAHGGQRCFLFFHLPLYLCDLDEPGLGHYDTINPPARDRLHRLITTHRIELLFSGHVHFPFYDQVGVSRYYLAPSPAFTRPGFAHLFASAPPSERGRDDVDKLGFYLIRVFADRCDVHMIRTGGSVAPLKNPRLISAPSVRLPHSPVSLTLGHAITPRGEIPLAYPSAVRVAVRNDLYFLSLLEMGITCVRVAWRDLLDPFLGRRLAMLHSEGVALVATFLELGLERLHEMVRSHAHLIDTWEIQLAGARVPDADALDLIQSLEGSVEFSICPVLSHERVPGKQHLRTRVGYLCDELPGLNAALQEKDIHLSRVLCRVPPDASPWDIVGKLRPLSHVRQIDLSIELTGDNDLENANRSAEACFAIACAPGSRLFVGPLVDLDRTLDACHGLLDTRCNPRPAFHTVRSLNTLLFSPVHHPDYIAGASDFSEGARVLRLSSADRSLSLVVRDSARAALPDLTIGVRGSRYYDLARAELISAADARETLYPLLITGP
jgi:hypothetical protein